MFEDIRKHEPLWGEWYVESLIGQGSYGRVYRASRTEFGRTYESAVKIISVPQDENEVQRLKLEGLDDASVRGFFYESAQDIVSEIDLMREFSGTSHIVNILDHMIIDKSVAASQPGWDILIRMELLKSLPAHGLGNPLSVAEVVKLGIHICRALELCAQRNIIHRDVKPENIFISPRGDYKLGDFGIARQLERTMSGLSKKGSYLTMAPEVFWGEPYGASVDTYGLGLVMYTFLNKNRAPFMPPYPEAITPKDRESAQARRMSGEVIPEIDGVTPELNAVVLKACAANRRDRFTDPTAMRMVLESIEKGQGVVDCEGRGRGRPNKHKRKLAPGADGNTLHLLSDEDDESDEHEHIDGIADLTQADLAQYPPANHSANNTGMAKSDGGVVPDETDAPDTAQDAAKETSRQYNRVEHRDTPKKKSKKKPLIAAGIILALLAALGAGYGLGLFRPLTDMISNLGAKDNPQIAFGIRAAGESDIDVVLSNRAAADDVLDRFKAYYEDLVKGVAEKILSAEIEEAVEVVELRVNEQLEVVGIVAEMGELEGIGTPGTDADPNKDPNANPNENPNTDTDPDSNIEESPKARVTGINEAVDALIEGKKTTIKHPAAEGETIKDIAELYKEDNITAEAILEANRGLILITADGEAEDLTAATKLPEGTEIKVVATRPYFHVKVVWVGEETEEIVFETQTVKDDQLTLHTTEVKQEGEKGSKTISYDYVSRNGVVVESIHRGEKVVKEVVDRVVLEGTKPLRFDAAGKEITNEQLAKMVSSGEIPKGVTHLDLSFNRISDFSSLKTLTGLTELNLQGNAIGNNINSISALSSLTNLTTLNLSNNSINSISSLSSLTNLTTLNLSYNRINNINSISALGSLTNLTTLNLSNNRIQSLSDYAPLKSLKRLRELDIRENNVVSQLEAIASDLKKSLPNCTITYQ
ncbi:MAG: leucine-rich repeat protein [Peptococcaceae bacterium]|nr:leucine-rich repeat protein [Peptococcaceae bacterium]